MRWCLIAIIAALAAGTEAGAEAEAGARTPRHQHPHHHGGHSLRSPPAGAPSHLSGDAVSDDGTYHVALVTPICPPPCLHPPAPKIRIVAGSDPSAPVNAFYNSTWQTAGVNFLEIITNPDIDSRKQAYYAGLIEGYLTADLITIWQSSGIEEIDPKVTAGEQAFVEENLKWMQEMISSLSSKDPWWYQMQLLIDQIQGLSDGYGLTLPNISIPFSVMYWSTLAAGDLDDLPCVVNAASPACRYVYAPNPFAPPSNMTRDELKEAKAALKALTGGRRKPRMPPMSHCTGIVKLLDDKSDIYVGHGVWDDYNSMIRIVKKYNFSFRQTADPNSALIPATGHLYTGYPGVLVSGDDFWMTSQELVMVSSEIGPIPDVSLYKSIRATGIRFESFRQIIAARLSTSLDEYASNWMISNSGTANSEWLIVDYKRFTPSAATLKNNTVMYLAQIPGEFVHYDVTDVLEKQGYLGTWNIPSDKNVYSASGWPQYVSDRVNTYGYGQAYANIFTYDKNPRALITARDHTTITDIASFELFMRYNQYTTDDLSEGPGTPAANPWNAISARADLVGDNADEEYDYPVELLQDCFGGTDGKVVSSDMVKTLDILIQVGPTHDTQAVFNWSDYEDNLCSEENYPHQGFPDSWDFDWEATAWKNSF